MNLIVFLLRGLFAPLEKNYLDTKIMDTSTCSQ